MSTKTDEEANAGCTFHWKIENVSHSWWMKKGEKLESPVFIVAEDTKWSLWLYLKGKDDENNISFYLRREVDCGGPNEIEIIYELACIGIDSSFLIEKQPLCVSLRKDGHWGFRKFGERKRVFLTDSEAFLPEDNLTVRCTIFSIDKKPVKSSHMFAITDIKLKRRSLVWRIDRISTIKSVMRKKFNDFLIDFDLVLNECFGKLDVKTTPFDDSIKYISFSTAIIDADGRKENCEVKKYFASDLEEKGTLSSTLLLPKLSLENNSKYFPNNSLSFDFEYVISTVEHFSGIKNSTELENEGDGKEKYRNTTVLSDDFRSLYNDGIFSDTELRTSTKTFPAHKGILSARSPVFRGMFSNDMKEKNCGYVTIDDFKNDTIHRMLLYIYTDSLEDLKIENASELYKIADKYQILSLKSRCSSFFEDNLCPAYACEVLVLAVLHSDGNLKSVVEDYILRQHDQFFCSREWKDFMKAYSKLAADLMLKKITKNKMYVP